MSNTNQVNCISLYCGAGGIDEGLKQCGIKTTIAIDFNEDACKTMKLNHPECEVICGKVGDYIESLPKSKIVVGGPPCPEFSRAKNTIRTFDMCEVNNFWKVVQHCKANYFLMENVQDVKKKLYKTNYLINVADYGVPQIRLRRFFTNLPRPEPSHSENPQNTLSGNKLKKWVSVKQALNLEGNGYIEDRKTKYFGETEYRKYPIERPINTVITDSRSFFNERKLTNDEFRIIQGFPDSYQFYGNKGSVLRQIGNAVPPPITKAFFQQIIMEILN